MATKVKVDTLMFKHSWYLRICVTFWDMFDKRGGSSGHSTDEGSRTTGQTFIRQPEEVWHSVTDAAHQAGRTAQDLQRAHHPAWERKPTGTWYMRQEGMSAGVSGYFCFNILSQILRSLFPVVRIVGVFILTTVIPSLLRKESDISRKLYVLFISPFIG